MPSISQFMAYSHVSVNDISKMYLQTDRRYNYTTPKSFLEQINLYQNLLLRKNGELRCKMERLENGLDKLRQTASHVRHLRNETDRSISININIYGVNVNQVDDLKAKLAEQEKELKQKNDAADKLIQVSEQSFRQIKCESLTCSEHERWWPTRRLK